MRATISNTADQVDHIRNVAGIGADHDDMATGPVIPAEAEFSCRRLERAERDPSFRWSDGQDNSRASS